MTLQRQSATISILGYLMAMGCATVHQPPGIDTEMMTTFQAPAGTYTTTDSLGTRVQFDLSIEEAVTAITDACYELEIPLYHPMITSDRRDAWLVSGPFIARCKRDCECGKHGASGHGADLASGTISLKLVSTPSEGIEQVLVEISSMFFRTQSTGGEYGSTINLYFNSLGYIENVILERLAGAQGNKSYP